jgi:hypothetical protein
MAQRKKARRGTARPDAGDELATLYFYFVHAELLESVMKSLAARLRKEPDPDLAMSNIQSGHPLPIWSSMVLHNATLFTVIEGWRRVAPGDDEIDKLVAEPFAERLRDFRDGVFHYGSIHSPAITSVMRDRPMIAWSVKLQRALRRFFDERFPGETKAGRVRFGVT